MQVKPLTQEEYRNRPRIIRKGEKRSGAGKCLLAGAVLIAAGVFTADKLYQEAEPPTVVRLSYSKLLRADGIAPPGYAVVEGFATDLDEDGRYDLVVSSSSGKKSHLHIQTAAGLKNGIYLEKENPILGIGYNEATGHREIYVTTGDGFLYVYGASNGVGLLARIPKPRIIGNRIFSVVDQKTDGTQILDPFVFRDGKYMPTGNLTTCPPEVRFAEERIASLSRSYPYSGRELEREVDRIVGQVPEAYRHLLDFQDISGEGLAIAFADRLAMRLAQEAGYDLPEHIFVDLEGNPYVADSYGNKRPPRIAPSSSFEFAGERLWHDTDTGYFYTLGKDGQLKDKLRVGRGGELVYVGPAQTDFAPSSPMPEGTQARAGGERTVIEESRTGSTMTLLEVYGNSHDPGVLSAQEEARRRQLEENLAQGAGQASRDIQRGIDAAQERTRKTLERLTNMLESAPDKEKKKQ